MTVYISNLDSRTTENDLLTLFSEYGKLHSSQVRSIMDTRTRSFNTFAYVEFSGKEIASQAIEKYNHIVFLGREIKMEQSG